jgi:hypothetical protein
MHSIEYNFILFLTTFEITLNILLELIQVFKNVI